MSLFYNSPSYLIRLDNNDFKGIMTDDELDNLQEDICNVIQYPTTIIDNRIDSATGQNIRVDSGRSSFVYCSACSAFRICDKSKQCLDSDNVHANIIFQFADDIVRGNIHRVNEKIQKYFINEDHHNYYDNGTELPTYVEKHIYCKKLNSDVVVRYLKYMCPIMGLTELIFPIIVEQKVVAVLFVGQLYIKDKSEYIRKCREQLLTTQEKMFIKYFDEYNVSLPVRKYIYSLIKKVNNEKQIDLFNLPGDEKTKSQTIGHQRQTFADDYELEEYICNTIFPEIWITEKRIDKMLKSRRDQHISRIVNSSRIALQNKIERLNLKETSTDILRLFWENVCTNLSELMKELGLNGFEIYTYNQNNSNEKTFYLSCCEDTQKSKKSHKEFNECFTVSKKELHFLKSKEQRLNVIKEKLQLPLDTNPMVLYHELLTQKCIAIIYFDEVYEKNSYYKLLEPHLLNNLINIMHEHAIVLNITEVEKTKKTLRIYRHEISHLNLGLTGIYYNFESPLNIRNLPDDKIKDIHDDFKSSIDIMNYMTAEIGLFTGAITNTENIYIEEFKIYKELIWKWETLYRNELKKESKRIKTIRGEENWETYLGQRPLIKSDRKLLEVIIYNIVNNAIKYSFFGTNIHITCDLIENGPKQSFKVIDYGNSIATNAMPYQLYFRDENIKEYTTDGNGIGLYVSKVAANILGIEINHTCKKISNYNIALIQKWIDYFKCSDLHEQKNPYSKQIDDLLAERDRLINEGIYYNVVNDLFQTKVTKQQVIEEINEPTYEVKFEVII